MQSAAIKPSHYHLTVHTLSKLKGHSIQAAAAYRRAERFEGNGLSQLGPNSVTHAAAYQRAQELGNNGQVFDYRAKIGVAWTGIMAPIGTPQALLEPQMLWNTVERIEARKNARFAREMIIALPHQVDLATHVTMLRAFVTAQLVSRGMVADVAIHRPPVEHGGDPRNWHAHVLLTDRPMTPAGFAATKDTTWNKRENIGAWREAWAACHNTTMETLNLPWRIDHRTLNAQRADALALGDVLTAMDLDRTPQIHVGKAAYAKHPHRPIYLERLAQNRAILAGNKSRAAARADTMASLIARETNAAFLEARNNAQKLERWRPETEPLTLDDLQSRYGRRPSLFTRFIQPKIDDEARHVASTWGWTDAADSGTVLAFLRTESALDLHKKPTTPAWFVMSARDFAFVFYNMGLMTRRQLQTALETDAEIRAAKRAAPRPKPLAPKTLSQSARPPTYPTPHADRLDEQRQLQPHVDAIYRNRLAQLAAFRDRHETNARARRLRSAHALKRHRTLPGASLT